jgi:hypothetical protein
MTVQIAISSLVMYSAADSGSHSMYMQNLHGNSSHRDYGFKGVYKQSHWLFKGQIAILKGIHC